LSEKIIKGITPPQPKSQQAVVDTARDILRLCMTNKVKSLSVSVHYVDDSGAGTYSTFEAHSDDYPPDFLYD